MISLKLRLIYFYHSKWSISETKNQIFTASPSRTSLSTQSQQSPLTFWPCRTWLVGWWARWRGSSPAWRGRKRCLTSLLRRENIKNTRSETKLKSYRHFTINTPILLKESQSKFSKLTAIFLLQKVWFRSVPQKTVVKKVVCVSGGWSVRRAVPRRIPAGVPTISSGLWEGVWV